MSRVMLSCARSWPTRPAACHVVPQDSWPCSSNTMSFQPAFARWYATLQPMMRPPMITTRAWVGTVEFEITVDCRERCHKLPHYCTECHNLTTHHAGLPARNHNRQPQRLQLPAHRRGRRGIGDQPSRAIEVGDAHRLHLTELCLIGQQHRPPCGT